ncbi:MAG: lia operon protein LiaG [Blastocatellia bacterium]
MSSQRNNKRGTLLLGLLLVGVGVLVLLAPAGLGVRGWLMRLWPILLICAGVIRVMGFAVERKPRSPVGGMLLIIIGALFFISRFHSDLNAVALYGRYWMLLLLIFAGIELVRFYTHRHAYGPPPRLLTVGRILVVVFIISTGVLANRMANSPAVLSALQLPRFLDSLRDSVAGQSFDFTDAPVESREFMQGMKITVANSYGNVKINGGSQTVKATLTKRVRGWSADDARRIADQVSLTITKTSDGLLVTTTRNEINQDFTTDIQIDVPLSANLVANNSYGAVAVSNLQNNVQIKTSHGQADVNQVNGNVKCDLSYANANAANINGDLIINGAKGVRLSNINGAVQLAARNDAVELKEISGPVHVNAPFCSIRAQGLSAESELKTEHGKVEVTGATNLIIEAPFSDVRAQTINGDLTVHSSNSSIQLATVSGTIEVNADKCNVSVEDARGEIAIETSHGEVVVKDFYEGVHVETSYGTVTLVAAKPPENDIDVKNSHGEIKLVLPSSSQFMLNAASENGEIRPIGFSGLASRTREPLIAANGDGPNIILRTSFRNITIQASGARQAQASARVN